MGTMDSHRLAEKGEVGVEVTSVTWHSKGDYLATIVSTGGARAVVVHQVRGWGWG